MTRYQHQRFPFVRPSGLDGPERTPVLIAGAGPVGLALSIDLALHGIRSILVDDGDTVSVGSRAICWSKRTLEIFDRLGVADRMRAKGVTWKVGRLFHRNREVYSFDLLPEPGHKHPAFVNLQQYYVEEFLIDRVRDFPDLIDLRFKSKVVGLERASEGVSAEVDTPVGRYRIDADWLVACDGVRSTVRGLLGLEFVGRTFEERFLITDIEMRADFPPERWFWFEPPFHDGQSALLHKQPDDIWRIDLQLEPEADPEVERRPETVLPRIRAVVGERPFEIDWISVYTFQCRRLERFVHGRVVFAGDSAHIVSPFGARGGNGGIQDVDNLGWKLAAVLQSEATERLIATYDEERIRGADENILNSARATGFMTPKSAMERMLREEVLAMAATEPFARRLVNSGRLSLPCSLDRLSLQSDDDPGFSGGLGPGSPCIDAPVWTATSGDGWLLNELGGEFCVMTFGAPIVVPKAVRQLTIGVAAPPPGNGFAHVVDREGLVSQRYSGAPGAAYLIRPDQHVAARWLRPTPEKIAAALRRALGGEAI
ncbi:MAG: FAD-dependent oxidoreductase [Hyphomicrobiaceae bacterium]|nr:FAD-dependent oxidoreductase [Hyphomicrobiaceae bacterium]